MQCSRCTKGAWGCERMSGVYPVCAHKCCDHAMQRVLCVAGALNMQQVLLSRRCDHAERQHHRPSNALLEQRWTSGGAVPFCQAGMPSPFGWVVAVSLQSWETRTVSSIVVPSAVVGV
eukprot:1024580-Pelagomonas_calceolata.AAC.1